MSTVELSQSFYFECAHSLRREIDTDMSRRVHGHTYHAEVSVMGTPDADTGMVVDLGHLRHVVGEIRAKLTHRLLNEVDDLGGQATLENLCHLILREASARIGHVSAVSVWRQASGDRCVLRVTR